MPQLPARPRSPRWPHPPSTHTHLDNRALPAPAPAPAHPSPLPACRQVIKSKLTDAIVSHGSYLRECNVNHAIIGLRSRIMENVTIQVRGGALPGVQHHACCAHATNEKAPA